jgi:hypothetical protein
MPKRDTAPLYKRYAASGFTPFPGRGGPRLSAGRSSLALTYSACQSIIDAALYAAAVRLPLNRFITIHWERGKVDQPLSATGRFLKLATGWLRSKGVATGNIWVRESGVSKGDHVHILMHVPQALAAAFGQRQQGWLKTCGVHRAKGVVLTRPVGRSYDDPPTTYAANLDNVLGYFFKGADDEAHHRLCLNADRRRPGGRIVGKRSGFSQNLGPAARSQTTLIVRTSHP